MNKSKIEMKKAVITLSICIIANLTGFGQEKTPQTYDDGVIINGVKWATCNVDEASTFAPTPESAGKFYQWNRKKAWNATDQEVTDWDETTPEGTEWEKVNDPSPAGWRVPTSDEIKSLLDEEKVSIEWITQNGINGRKFTDKTTDKSIFLPAVGFRSIFNGTLRTAGVYGYYWSSTQHDSDLADRFAFCNEYANWYYLSRKQGFSVRCVTDK
jgi:uncharacterized protein (TIGR02145 family)